MEEGSVRRFLFTAGMPGWRWAVYVVVVGSIVLSVGLLSVCAPASAEFSRPFKTVVESTPIGPFGELGCIAVDTGEGGNFSGNWWVGDLSNQVLDEFDASNGFIKVLSGQQPSSCAFDILTGELLSRGTEEWVAVDDSPSMDRGDVYIAHQGNAVTSGWVERNVRKPNGSEEPADFTCSEPGAGEYIEGNRLTGKPGERWQEGTAVEGVTIDSSSRGSAGDIYVINNKGFTDLEVDEFTSAGCFVRAIASTREVEKNGKKELEALFEGYVEGVAVDPTDGDVLIKSGISETGVVDEFSSSGKYLGRITGRSKGEQFGSDGLSRDGIAVSSEGNLYVDGDEKSEDGSEKHVVYEFGPGAYYPGAVTGEVSDVEPETARLNGVVKGVENSDAEDLILSNCYFEYVTEEEFVKENGFGGGLKTPCALNESGLNPVHQRLREKNYEVYAGISGLMTGVVYRYRLVAESSPGEFGGVEEGEGGSFASPASRWWVLCLLTMFRRRMRISTLTSIRLVRIPAMSLNMLMRPATLG